MRSPKSPRTVAVVGPGAIGATLSARLDARTEHRVVVAARTPFDRIVVDTAGGSIHAAPRVLTEPRDAASVDWVLVTTKAYDAVRAARWLPGFVGAGTRVAIIQNGVEHLERFEPWVDRERMIPVMIDLPAERIGPGRVRQRGRGVMTIPDTPAGSDFAGIFAGSGIDVATTPDMTTALWRKLCINSVGALNAATLTLPRIARHDGVADLMRAIVGECIAVGQAEGANLPDDLADDLVGAYRTGPGDGINSLQADRLAGRPMEIDARNGAIVRAGARHGVPTPWNAMLVAVLEGIEQSASESARPDPHGGAER